MITKEVFAKALESAHPIAGDTETLQACIEQLLKERDAYREVAIQYCGQATRQMGNGKYAITPLEMTKVDMEAQKLLSKPVESK